MSFCPNFFASVMLLHIWYNILIIGMDHGFPKKSGAEYLVLFKNKYFAPFSLLKGSNANRAWCISGPLRGSSQPSPWGMKDYLGQWSLILQLLSITFWPFLPEAPSELYTSNNCGASHDKFFQRDKWTDLVSNNLHLWVIESVAEASPAYPLRRQASMWNCYWQFIPVCRPIESTPSDSHLENLIAFNLCEI